MEIFFLIGRLLLGGFFIYSGFNHFDSLAALTGYAASKKVPMPKTAVAVTGPMLLFGGLSIFFGVWVHVGIWVLIVFLLGATYGMHGFWTMVDPMQKMNERVSFMKNIALIGALLMLLTVATPWALSLF
jgi:uncharacterized membrane protein YphA (DoxX/SURF4 family)